MKKRSWQQDMYDVAGACVAQRLVLAGIAGVITGVAWWLLLGDGLATLGGWLGWNLQAGSAIRRLALAVGFSVYCIRILFTVFVFLRRGMGWLEVFSIAPFMLFAMLLMGVSGGTNHEAFGWAGRAGVILFLAGSWINSYAEYQRHVWKLRPENRGHLYTRGLFRFSRHPNYFGDLVLFSGLGLISRAWVTALIPLAMLAGFVFANIPALDSHLRERYGAEFDAYARRTKKLIPCVY